MRNRFEHYLHERAGRCASTTLVRVRAMLADFVQWLVGEGIAAWYEVTPEQVRQWAAWKSGRVKPCTMHAYKLEVRSFFAWMYRNEYLLVNTWDESLDEKKPPYVMRRMPTVREAEVVLEKVVANKRVGARDRAILELAYGCGLRRKEIQRLNLSDIREDWLRVRGKGGRERVVPLGQQAKESLMRYIATERTKPASVYEPALFLTYYGTRLGVEAYGYVLRRGGLNRTTTLHGLRHACATHMLRNGASIAILQKLLGHRKLSSTELYTHVDRSDLARVLLTFHPRG